MSDKLAGVHPRLAVAVHRILDAMETLGHPMMVTDGVRTHVEQAALYAKGRTAPGDIVTNADGVIKRSNHQPHGDGLGHAVDCAFVDEHGKPRWIDDDPWELYGAMAKALRLKWGGGFTTIKGGDRPHIELPD